MDAVAAAQQGSVDVEQIGVLFIPCETGLDCNARRLWAML